MALRIGLGIALLAMTACARDGAPEGAPMRGYEIVSERAPAHFNGESDDLLTGGLGLAGLNAPAAPAGASLRTKAIHYNFRALIDVTETGGFTRLYGPNKARIKVAGEESLALLRLDGMAHPFAVALAIPLDFDLDRPCLIIAPSSGSRGLYGAIGTVGPFAFSRRCAVVFTDKTTGTGLVHLDTGESYDVGLALTKDPAESIFTLSNAREAGAALGPGAVAVKHAHSRENVERVWGLATLAAGDYALDALARRFPDANLSRARVTVIAASISNGGKAAVMAAEADRRGLLDGVVASEPNLSPAAPGRVFLGEEEIAGAGAPLYEYASMMNLLAPCAALAAELSQHPGAAFSAMGAPAHGAWCEALARAGHVSGETTEERAEAALAAIRALGFAHDTEPLFHYGLAIKLWPALAVGYANAYGRYDVTEAPCGAYYAFAAPDGAARPASAPERELFAALSSGIPPGGVEILNRAGASAFETAQCFRALWEEDGSRIREGSREVLNSGDHGRVPVIILHGRSDSLLPVSHTSRAYMSAARGQGPLRYFEIEGGQHFDSLLMLPDLAALYAPMQPHFEKSLDLMLAHLRDGAPLPPSQLVRHTARGAGPLQSSHLGEIAAAPGANAIEVRDGAVRVPR